MNQKESHSSEIDITPFSDLMERSFDFIIRSVNEQLKEAEENKSLERADWLLKSAEETLERAGRFLIETANAEKLKRL
ncbi:MAG: hypothetical protein KDD62_08685 [Bdellovibrionales bacterium]|nr:hypothetical protein [Bdellovibrionales bacterium]